MESAFESYKEIQNLQNDIKKWSDKTFGTHRTGKPIAYHLKKEIDELIEALDMFHQGIYSNKSNKSDLHQLAIIRKRVIMELADCFTLLIDSAAHEQITIEMLVTASKEKLEINKKRKWGIPDENGVVEHIEE